ncbi:hypothetical protein [Streptomyces sp. NBC_01565]|uniref:hypothetical protein n=1 Tax=unclassified Streptomyces TaxID=2593676 RepID=UPI002254DB29|nr:hypothetical protein [Streptomyces sp. NBC_01565]MCX4546281.1 hypothetical protein [Streptomyces sp. NBC_01565]
MKTVGIVAMMSVAVLATGCGGSGAKSAKPEPSVSRLPNRLDRPGPLPEGELQPSPAADAPFAANVEYAIRKKALGLGGGTGEVTAKCPKDFVSTKGATAVCTSEYKGAVVEWDVTIGDKSGWSDNLVTYTATPRQGLITQEGVRRIIFGNSDDTLDHILCNDIPEAVTVPMGPTQYTCQQVMKDGQVYYPQPMRATDIGPRAY